MFSMPRGMDLFLMFILLQTVQLNSIITTPVSVTLRLLRHTCSGTNIFPIKRVFFYFA